jgi:hypothetical protein
MYYCSFTNVHTVSLVSLENILTRGYHTSSSSTPESPSMRVFDDLLLLNDEALGSLQAYQKLIKYFEHSKNGWCHPDYWRFHSSSQFSLIIRTQGEFYYRWNGCGQRKYVLYLVARMAFILAVHFQRNFLYLFPYPPERQRTTSY